MDKYEPYNKNPPKEKKFKLQYDSNNSGGSWWLKDEDWYNLEKQGWKVWWFKDDDDTDSKFKKGEIWLGARANQAEKEFDSLKDGILEFEKITGQSVTDSGCSCCGRPHSFSYIDQKGEYNHLDALETIVELATDKDDLIKRLMTNV